MLILAASQKKNENYLKCNQIHLLQTADDVSPVKVWKLGKIVRLCKSNNKE